MHTQQDNPLFFFPGELIKSDGFIAMSILGNEHSHYI